MIVIGYQQKTVDKHIVISGWHKGHLGLIPGTQVNLSITEGKKEGCEMTITPFSANQNHLVSVKCILVDKPGVVSKVLRAVAAIGANIISLESTSIELNQKHIVSMILDWSTSALYDESDRIEEGAWHDLAPLHGILPNNLTCYFKLLMQLVKECGEDLDWTKQDPALPSVTFVPFEAYGMQGQPIESSNIISSPPSTSVNVEARVDSKSYMLIPKSSMNIIAASTFRTDKDEFPYILTSDTETRSMRAFFPSKNYERGIHHFAIVHANLPGALDYITELVRDKYNILVSLIRKENHDHNIWEGILHLDVGRNAKVENDPAMLHYFVLCLQQASSHCNVLSAYYKLVATFPKYPNVKMAERELQVSKFTSFDEDDINWTKDYLSQRTVRSTSVVSGNGPLTSEISSPLEEKKYPPERDWIYSRIGRLGGPPSVFLSYSKAAAPHAEFVKEGLVREYKNDISIIEYQIPDQGIIYDVVIGKIRKADYFFGIWHWDGSTGDSVSPWMPFELAVAMTLDKQYTLVVHESIKEEQALRIVKDRAIPRYSDFNFKDEVAPDAIKHCLELLTEQRRRESYISSSMCSPIDVQEAFDLMRMSKAPIGS